METHNIRSNIKQFFNVNSISGALHIDFDSMCIFLIKECRRQFSPAMLEKELAEEVKKLEGKILEPKLFDVLAEYIDQMTLYIQQESTKAGLKREETVRKKQLERFNARSGKK